MGSESVFEAKKRVTGNALLHYITGNSRWLKYNCKLLEYEMAVLLHNIIVLCGADVRLF